MITATFKNIRSGNLSNITYDVGNAEGILLLEVTPRPNIAEAPEHVPQLVAQHYLDAMENLQRGKWTPAAAMFRKTLETALKVFAPEVEAWMLEKRIDKLHCEGRITPAIRDWAHELRLDGNEALHDTAPADEDLAKQMQGLTEYILTYLFTLPEKVRQRREARRAAEGKQ